MSADDETLMRWSDGELPSAEARQLEAAALTDADLAARMSALRRVSAAAREAFPAPDDPRDAALTRLIAAPSEISRPSPAIGSRLQPRRMEARRAAPWVALAAAFVGGLWLGPHLREEPGFEVTPGGTLTDPALIQALDRRLAGEGADPDGHAVGLTFQDAERRWCRTFRSRTDGMAGLACREGDGWALRVLAPTVPDGGEVRMASADTPDAVLAAVDAIIAGPSLDAEAERRARDDGWR